MKQLLFSKALLSAATLMVGTVAFTSCSNDEFDANTNPTYDGESVKTQFAINIPAAKGTRMTGDIVQEGGNFRGMTNIKLIPFASTPDNANDANLGSVISLTDIESLIGTSNAKVYNDVSIPVGTGAVLLYGQAKNSAGADNFTDGAVKDIALDDYSTLSSIKFTPVNIVESTLTNSVAENLATWMSGVANATGWAEVSQDGALKDLRNEYLKATVGSSNSVLCLMQYLYNSVKNISGNEEVVNAIKAAILNDGKITAVDAVDGVTTLSYVEGSDLSGYPGNINLPDGAARVEWKSDKFEVVSSNGNTGLNVASLNDYIYPAPLCYYVNSAIKTADTEVNMEAEMEWGSITGSMSGNTVKATTRSIAIENTINYGVGRLDVKAIFNADRVPDSKDDDQIVSLVTIPAEGFKITGILVGGQGEVAWNYVPVAVGTKTIYDKTMVDGMCAKYATDYNSATTNYTLVYETVAQNDVNVAIEFENGDTDFYGYNGEVIPAGGKFYLVGQLTHNESETDGKVFKQDCHTIAKFNIKSLANAYNGLPDLRTPELKLGMSVDLEWKEGLEDEIIIQ